MTTVIIPTYNPDEYRLNLTISGLKAQTLSSDQWELIIVDNNSFVPVNELLDLGWHPCAKIVVEKKQGLTYARMKGFAEATGDIIILVDDDNILSPNYLEHSVNIFNDHIFMGAAGGKSIPLFERQPKEWIFEFYGNLALRDLGNESFINQWEHSYPPAAPLGAGMILRKKALENYVAKITLNKNVIADRQGSSLSSGGDNDIVLEVIKAGYQVGYFPSLTLTHVIPAERISATYLARLLNNINRSWIKVLASHGINPWRRVPRWTLPLRKAKAWLTYKAYLSEVHYIRWKGACGTFDGLAEID